MTSEKADEKLPLLFPRGLVNWGGIRNVLAFVGAVFLILTTLTLLGVDVQGALSCPDGQERVVDGTYRYCE